MFAVLHCPSGCETSGKPDCHRGYMGRASERSRFFSDAVAADIAFLNANSCFFILAFVFSFPTRVVRAAREWETMPAGSNPFFRLSAHILGATCFCVFILIFTHWPGEPCIIGMSFHLSFAGLRWVICRVVRCVECLIGVPQEVTSLSHSEEIKIKSEKLF